MYLQIKEVLKYNPLFPEVFNTTNVYRPPFHWVTFGSWVDMTQWVLFLGFLLCSLRKKPGAHWVIFFIHYFIIKIMSGLHGGKLTAPPPPPPPPPQKKKKKKNSKTAKTQDITEYSTYKMTMSPHKLFKGRDPTTSTHKLLQGRDPTSPTLLIRWLWAYIIYSGKRTNQPHSIRWPKQHLIHFREET